MNATIQRHVSAAVLELLREQPSEHLRDPAYLHGKLLPYVESALQGRDGPTPAPAPRDRRAKPWEYVARFWRLDDLGEADLIGETDRSIMYGTGQVPAILARLAGELHGGIPGELHPAITRRRLPQLRNNLGRAATSSTLRITYDIEEGEQSGRYLCQLDIYRVA